MLGIASLTTLAGCASVATDVYQPHGASQRGSPAFLRSNDLAYYLPLVKLKATYSRTKADDATLQKAKASVVDKTAEEAAATKRLEDAKATAKEATALAAAGGSQRRAKNAAAAVTYAGQQLNAATAARKAAVATLDKLNQARGSGSAFVEDIKIEALAPTADTRHLLVARLLHAPTQKSEYVIETTPGGLLKSASSTTRDETPAIVTKLAEIAIEAAKVFAGGVPIVPAAASGREALAASSGNCLSKLNDSGSRLVPEAVPAFAALKDREDSFEFVFDPANLSEVAALNRHLCERNAEIEVRVVRPAGSGDLDRGVHAKDNQVHVPATGEPGTAPVPNADGPKDAIRVDGLLYRRPLPYQVGIYRKVKGEIDRHVPGATYSGVPMKVATMDLPNGGPISSLPFEWGACIEAKYAVSFESGIPVRQEINRPSEVLGCLDIPLAIVRAIVRLPTELIQFRINYDSKQSEYIEGRKKLLDAQGALQDADKAAADGGASD